MLSSKNYSNIANFINNSLQPLFKHRFEFKFYLMPKQEQRNTKKILQSMQYLCMHNAFTYNSFELYSYLQIEQAYFYFNSECK